MDRSVFFGFGKQIIKVCADNPVYLKDIKNLLIPFHLKNPARETVSFKVVFPLDSIKEKISSYLIFQDRKEIFKTEDPFRALFRMEWLIVRSLLGGADFLQFHAAAVEKDGKAILFPAAPNCGKTSLSVALLQNDFKCFSDEIALVDPESLFIHPFPRNIHIEPEKKDLFLGLNYRLKFKKLKWNHFEEENLEYGAETIFREKKKSASKAKYIVFPKYSATHNNKLISISRAKAFMGLIKNEINFYRFQAKGLDIIEGLVKGADCYELQTGDLEGAVAVIKDLFHFDT